MATGSTNYHFSDSILGSTHWAKRIDQVRGNLFGFLVVAVIWKLSGSLNLRSINGLWIRISLTMITLLFLLFNYLTQDLLPKRRIQDLLSQDGDLRLQVDESLSQMEPEDLADIRPEAKQEMVEVLAEMGSKAIPTIIR